MYLEKYNKEAEFACKQVWNTTITNSGTFVEGGAVVLTIPLQASKCHLLHCLKRPHECTISCVYAEISEHAQHWQEAVRDIAQKAQISIIPVANCLLLVPISSAGT